MRGAASFPHCLIGARRCHAGCCPFPSLLDRSPQMPCGVLPLSPIALLEPADAMRGAAPFPHCLIGARRCHAGCCPFPSLLDRSPQMPCGVLPLSPIALLEPADAMRGAVPFPHCLIGARRCHAGCCLFPPLPYWSPQMPCGVLSLSLIA